MNNPAVLLITWNRPATTRQTLLEIIKSKPRRIYVSADGPRPNIQSDVILCEQTRAEVISMTHLGDFELRFLESNGGGARRAILGAMEWFFSQEDEGIVLEDDSLPTPDFFRFCSEMLERFRGDSRIFQVSGCNFSSPLGKPEKSYYFSTHQHIWGFATWRRSWLDFHEMVSEVEERNAISWWDALPDTPKGFRECWRKRVIAEDLGIDDNWDSTWNLRAKTRRQLSVTPAVSLVCNIGFGIDSLHSNKVPLISGPPPKPENIRFPLAHPDLVVPDVDRDNFVARVQWSVMPIFLRFLLAGLEKFRRLFIGSSPILPGPISAPEVCATQYQTIAQRFWARVSHGSRTAGIDQ